MREGTIREVEQFLYRETRLLDERRFHEWLELFTDDVRYWMAGGRNRYPKTGKAWAEDPPSRTRHLLTNIEVEPGDAASELEVYSNFTVYRSRSETEQDF